MLTWRGGFDMLIHSSVFALNTISTQHPLLTIFLFHFCLYADHTAHDIYWGFQGSETEFVDIFSDGRNINENGGPEFEVMPCFTAGADVIDAVKAKCISSSSELSAWKLKMRILGRREKVQNGMLCYASPIQAIWHLVKQNKCFRLLWEGPVEQEGWWYEFFFASLFEELEIISESESELDANNWRCFVNQIFCGPATLVYMHFL